jgi:hypothetical protein
MPLDRWKNRRRMAWLCLIAGLLYPVLLLASASPGLESMSATFYMFVSAVVGSYMGFATLDDKWQNKDAT